MARYSPRQYMSPQRLLSDSSENDGAFNHIAIVGMAGRFPECESVGELWELLKQQKATHKEIPTSRFDIDDYYDASGQKKNSTKTRYGCFLDRPGIFDNRFFNISPREAAQMDPLQRMFLTTTHEALEMAGYNPDSEMVDRDRISTYFGQSTDDWRTINEQQGIQAHYLPCTNRSFAPGRVNHHFKWGGGYYSIDTGCSSSATAIHLACNALLAGESDMCIVGGGNLCVIPEYFSGFSLGSFLSTTGGCKTFSDAADGYCRGEAVGTVILKRVENALAANDNILGVIAATARNTNAGEDSITYPGENSQIKLLESVLKKAGATGNEVGYVEMHGTGTQAGDLVEMSSVHTVLTLSRDTPLHVGAIKANIGHGEAAAGISSLIKAVLVLQHDTVPGQPGPFTLNSKFSDLASTTIPTARGNQPCIARSSVDGKRKAIVNSFDAAGGNTSILLQDGPVQPHQRTDPRTHFVVTFSAKTAKSLEWTRDRLRKHLEQHKPRICDISYTTTARRIHHAHREAYVADSVEQLLTKLEEPPRSSPSADCPSLLFAFTGQSSQYTAMGANLYHSSPRFRNLLIEYDIYCTKSGFGSFLDMIKKNVTVASPSRVQLAIVSLEIALATFLQTLGMKPTAVIGHSLGEYSALCVAGVLSVKDALCLVHKRAALLERHCAAGSWGMMALARGAETTKRILSDTDSCCEICCLNGPFSTVVGGPLNDLYNLEEFVSIKGITVTRLKVPYAFHSTQMDSILAEYEKVVDGVEFGTPSIPMASTLTGDVVTSAGTFNSSYLVQQCRQQVDFVGALKACEANGLISDNTMVVEIGPHPVCIGLFARSLPNIQLTCIPTLQRWQPDWEGISRCLATAYMKHHPVNWEAFHDDYRGCLSLLDLPSYAFEENEYWTPYKRQRETREEESPVFSTTSLQLLQYSSSDKKAAGFVSRVREEFLLKAIQGHLVDEVAICPASLFLDMVWGAASALSTTPAPNDIQLEIVSLEMTAPLVVSALDAEQAIHVEAKAEATRSSVTVKISSVSQDTHTPTEHAGCSVMIHDNHNTSHGTSLSIWSQVQRLIKHRISALSNPLDNGYCHKMAKGLFYKLFDSIVEYSTPFKVLDNIAVDKSFQDAIAEIGVPSVTDQGSFSLDPFTMDALIHLPGFLLNCNFEKPKGDMHIAKSIGRVLVLDTFLAGTRPLTCYASIREQGADGTTICDTYLFKDATLAVMIEGICFQKISRRIFSVITGGSQTVTANLKPNGPHILPSQVKAEVSSDTVPSSEAEVSPFGKEGLYSVLLRTIAETTGADIEDVKSATSFTSLGIDSHMGIAVIAEVNKATGKTLPAAFFNNFPTRAQAERELRTRDGNEIQALPSQDSTPRGASSSITPPSTPGTSKNYSEQRNIVRGEVEHKKRPENIEQAPPKPKLVGKAILLQGDPTSKKQPLFIVAEASGSLAPYIYLPPLPDNRPLYGLESPFFACPEKNTLSVPKLSAAYIETMRTVQPKGPHLIAGYSFAALYAYEMAYQLCVQGEPPNGLLIIDMYVPPPAPPIPKSSSESGPEEDTEANIETGMQRFSSNMFGSGPLAQVFTKVKKLFPGFTEAQDIHMAGSLRAAAVYSPIPIPADLGPAQTHIIWSTRGLNERADEGFGVYDNEVEGPAWMGVCEPDQLWNELSEEERGMLLRSWFFAPRRTFGSNGWEALLGKEIQIHTVDANHCSMMSPGDVQSLGEAMGRVVASCTRLG